MNLFKKTLLCLAVAFSAGAANAEVIKVFDTIAYESNVTVNTSTTLPLIHDITDGSNGYRFNLDKIISALLTVTLVDPDGGSEDFKFVIGTSVNPQTETDKNIANGTQKTYPFTLNTISLADLSADGKLSVNLSAQLGSFQFVSSVLSADVDRATPANAVPEPASAALLGLGLLGIAAARRKAGKRAGV